MHGHPLSRPLRWAQLTLVENDPGRYDPAFWLDYFRRTHAEGACLSAGGVVAYYPTKVPFHHRSAWMVEGTDPFGELARGCAESGMVVLARTDPHAIHADVFGAHPEWAARGADGKPRPHWSSPEMFVACPLGPYGFGFMSEVHRELASLYPVDGVFINRWAGSGPCWCESCREGFRSASGLDVPAGDDPMDRAVVAYRAWKHGRLLALWDRWQAEVDSVNPAVKIVPNTGGGELDLGEFARRSVLMVADRQARSGATPAWTSGRVAKEYRSAGGNAPAAVLFSVGLEEAYRWKDSVQTEAETRLWVADAVAHGAVPWYTKFSGHLYDRRWLSTVQGIFARHHAAERYLKGGVSRARVGLVLSQLTAGLRGWSRSEPHLGGMYQALVEARIPFDMVHESLLSPALADRYRLLVFPNVEAMSDESCAAVLGFAGRGGRVVATHMTGMFDGEGRPRAVPGLAGLLGVSVLRVHEGPMRNSYLAVAEPGHPLARGLADAGRIINGTRRVECEATDPSSSVPFRVVRPYPDLPMEKVYPREEPSEPGAVCVERGASRTVYFPFNLDAVFNEVMCADHARLLRNAFEWALDEPPPASVEGPGLVDISAWSLPGALTVHLVNLNNPFAMRGPARELLPARGLSVSLAIPGGAVPARARWLFAGSEVPPAVRNGRLVAEAPEIADHDILAVDL
jgi:hypothetical protein